MPRIDDQFEGYAVHHGDCMALLPCLVKARLIFADPPYNQGIDYGEGDHADMVPVWEYRQWTEDWVSLCARQLEPDGSLWILTSDENAAHTHLAMEKAGLHFRNWIKWYETFGVNCIGKFNRTSRHLLYFCKSARHRVFNADSPHVRRPSDRQTLYNDKRANPNGKLLDDVWTHIPRLAGTHAERIEGFPTQLPEALLTPIIAVATEADDVVIDPFTGSGTTGAVCVRMGRRFIGIEKNLDYVRIARARLAATGG
jgi:site-specific DNA-methyltransferase (adenine-specific)